MTGTVLTHLQVAPSGGTLLDLERAFGPMAAQTEATDLHIDLSGAGFLEPPATLFLLHRIRSFLTRSRNLSITLVASESSDDTAVSGHLDVLADAHFDDALDDLSGVRFLTLMDDRSKKYWNDAVARRTARSDRAALTASPRETLPAKSARLSIESSSVLGFHASVAANMSQAWQEPYVASILNAITDNRGRYIATHVVHEAGMNGVRHANADVVATLGSARNVDTSVPRGTASIEGPGELIFAIWDDGDSIADTLRTTPGLTAAAAASAFDDLFRRSITVTVGSDPDNPWTTSNQGPVQQDEPSSLLLAATFPGITSKPDEPSQVHSEARADLAGASRNSATRDDLNRSALPGMGLFVLTTTVTEILKGTVEIRSGHWYLTLSAGEEAQTLNAELRQANDPTAFVGNLITVRVPNARRVR